MSAAVEPAGYLHRLTGRFVMACDPTGSHPLLKTPFLARERSVVEWRGTPVQHDCELANGARFKLPPAWVSDCPENVLPWWHRP